MFKKVPGPVKLNVVWRVPHHISQNMAQLFEAKCVQQDLTKSRVEMGLAVQD